MRKDQTRDGRDNFSLVCLNNTRILRQQRRKERNIFRGYVFLISLQSLVSFDASNPIGSLMF